MAGAGAEAEATARRYVVEVAVEGGYPDVRRLSTRARAGATASGPRVRFLRTVYVPEDGVCLLIFEARTADAAREAAATAGLSVRQVSPALTLGDPEGER